MCGNDSTIHQPEFGEFDTGVCFVRLQAERGRQHSVLDINIVMGVAHREGTRIVSCTGHGWTQVKGYTGARGDVARLVDRGEREGTEGPKGVGADGSLAAVSSPGDSNTTGNGERRCGCEGGGQERNGEHHALEQ